MVVPSQGISVCSALGDFRFNRSFTKGEVKPEGRSDRNYHLSGTCEQRDTRKLAAANTYLIKPESSAFIATVKRLLEGARSYTLMHYLSN